MTRTQSGILAATAALTLASCQQAAQPVTPVAAEPGAPAAVTTDARPEAGRYQLFQGWYRFSNLKGEESRTETLFKIDTATGEIFECSSVQFVRDGKGTQRTACQPFESDLPLGPTAGK